MGEYAKADVYYDRALTFNPDLAMAYYNKAKLTTEKKRRIMAREKYGISQSLYQDNALFL